jgi:hypothetical protein
LQEEGGEGPAKAKLAEILTFLEEPQKERESP